MSCTHDGRANILCVSRKLAIFKARSIYDENCGNSYAMRDAFIASNTWLVKFISRNKFSLQKKTTIAKTDASHFTCKLIAYVMYVQTLTTKENYSPNCVTAMEKTVVCLDMVKITTVNATRVKFISQN